jgi:4-hydroxymandelate oxidase
VTIHTASADDATATPGQMPVNMHGYEARAQKLLPPAVAAYFASGADDEHTLRENSAAFARHRLLPRMLVDVGHRSTATSVLGVPLRSPIMVAPTAMQRLAHPEGELATARAAAAAGTIMTVSTVATRSLEAVAEARRAVDPQAAAWFQLYPQRDRGLTQALVDRAQAAGYGAIVVTVDTPVFGHRESDSHIPLHLPAGLALENFAGLEGYDDVAEISILQRFIAQQDPSYGWEDVVALCASSRLPIVLKGVLRGDDARRAAECGAAAVIVSNHGGRQLDRAVASVDALPAVVAVAGERIEVLVDGGVRRGVDVLVALALGAGAVLVGRPVLWGLALDGERGVRAVLDMLTAELDRAMALCGCAAVADVTGDLLATGPAVGPGVV